MAITLKTTKPTKIILSGGFTGPRGVAGADGTDGAAGQGVAAGGSTNQILRKTSGTDYDTSWSTETYADDASVETAYNNQVGQASLAEKTAGTETDVRRFSPKDVRDMSVIQADAAVAALVDSSPSTLDTLNEIAAAIGDDANYAATITAALGTKATDSDTVHLTGDETVAGIKTFSSSPVVPAPTTDLQAATKKYVDDNAGVFSEIASQAEAEAGTDNVVGMTPLRTKESIDYRSRVTVSDSDRGTYNCDGNADEVEINAAISFVYTMFGGGFVEIEPGTFNIDDTIILKDGVHLVGQGYESIIKLAVIDKYMITNENTASGGDISVSVRDLKLDGNSALSHTSEKAGIRFYGVSNGYVSNVRAVDNYGMGVWITETDDNLTAAGFSVIERSWVTGSNHHNITVDSGGGVIDSNVCDDAVGYDNIQVDTADKVRTVNNRCTNANRDNIRYMTYTTQTNEHGYIGNNVCDTAGAVNIYVTTNTTGIEQREVKVIGNDCIDSASWAIAVIRNPNANISNNTIKPGANTSYCVYVKDSDGVTVGMNKGSGTTRSGGRGAYIENSDECNIGLNTFNNHNQQGIELNGSDYCSVGLNTLRGNRNGVELTNSDHNTVTGNTISDCSFRGVEENGTSDYNFLDGNKFYNITSDIVTLVGDNSSMGVNHGLGSTRIRNQSAAYTIKPLDKLAKMSASGAARIVTLPPVGERNPEDPVTIIKIDTSSSTVTINADGSDTIRGAASYVLSTQYQTVTLAADPGSSEWIVTAAF